MSASPSAASRIAVIGSNGQLGTDLMKVLAGRDVVGLTHSDVDITQLGSVKGVLDGLRPQMVINTAAYNRVDECELHPETGFLVNAVGPFNLAAVCRSLGAVLVHFSSDYVFDGSKAEPYSETDCPSPINGYGISKLAGEHFVRYSLDRYFIIRTSGLYGKAGSRSKGGNFVEAMLKLGMERRAIRVVNDQTLSPTYTLDLANKVHELVFTTAFGLYHVTSAGSCTWHDFAKKVFELSGIAVDLTATTSEEYGSTARRPRFSVLQNRRLQVIGLGSLRPWEEALRAYLAE